MGTHWDMANCPFCGAENEYETGINTHTHEQLGGCHKCNFAYYDTEYELDVVDTLIKIANRIQEDHPKEGDLDILSELCQHVLGSPVQNRIVILLGKEGRNIWVIHNVVTGLFWNEHNEWDGLDRAHIFYGKNDSRQLSDDEQWLKLTRE